MAVVEHSIAYPEVELLGIGVLSHRFILNYVLYLQ